MSHASISLERNPRRILDDRLLTLGDDNDVALVLRSATLAADTALTGVLVGTPVTPALAANSLVLSNVTASGDIVVALNRGGNSEAMLFADGSSGALYLTPISGGLMVGLAADAPVPDNAKVHVWRGSAGAVSADGNSLLVLEHSGEVGLQLLSGNTSKGAINFGDDGSTTAGRILYNHGTGPQFETYIEGAAKLFYAAGSFQFQEQTRVRTTTGDLILEPAGDIILRPSGATQDYALTDRSTNLALVAQTSGVQSTLELFAKDGDGTDSLEYQLVAKGTPADMTNNETVRLMYNAGDTTFQLRTGASGTGTARNLLISDNGTAWATLYAGGGIGIGAAGDPGDKGALGFAEITAPGVAAANNARLYAVENGSGKTQLAVIFSSGAAQILATEP